MNDLIGALSNAIDRARADASARTNGEVAICFAGTCDKPAQPEHSPCCSSQLHGKSFCCVHYCRSHFVEANPCSPDSHAAASAASVLTRKA